MNSILTTSVKLPTSINNKLLHSVINDGYGMRGKSKWIVEAIESFLILEDYYELTNIADDIEELGSMLSLRISEDLANKLEKAVIEVRKYYPGLEGVKSKIVRASILQRMIRHGL